MKNLFFWNRWQKVHQLLYGAFFILFMISVTFFIYSTLPGKNSGIAWNVNPEIKTGGYILDNFQKGFFQFSVKSDYKYIIQSFEGNLINSENWHYHLIVFAIGLLLISGAVTTSYTKGIWYYVSLTAVAAFFYFLNLDVLEVFGLPYMYWTVGAFLVFGIVIHYFHSFNPLTPILIRYLVLSLITALFFYISTEYSRIENPFLHLAAFGWWSPFFLSLLFITIISTEILAGFLFLVTDAKHVKKSSSLLNFLLISLFFIGNLTLTILKNRGSIDWNIFYINGPILLLVSSVLGIWGLKKKEVVYQFISDFSPASAIWYLVLGTNCFLCYSFANITGNDPLQEVFEDGVVFTHLALGIIFILYVVANFMGMMEQNLPAHMVMYKPKYMPFAFVRIAGLMGVLSIVLYNSNYQYRQTISGNYITKAEVFLKEDNTFLGEEYLNSALAHDIGNHKANYLLAMVLRNKNKGDINAKGFLKQSMFKNPTAQAYASLGIFLLQEGDIIRSLEILKEGCKKFPDSKEILNNLGLAFSKTDIMDSTMHNFMLSRKADKNNYVASANQLAFALEHNIIPELDLKESVNDLSYNINLVALLNKSGKVYGLPIDTSFMADTSLSNIEGAYIYNIGLNNLSQNTFKTQWIDSLLVRTSNAVHFEDFMLVKAFRQYYSGNVAEGIITLDQLQATAQSTIRYNNTLSNWLIQQDAPRVAMDFLYKSKDAGDLNADFGQAIAASYYEDEKSLLNYWKNPIVLNDSVFRRMSFALHSNEINVFKAGIAPQLTSPDALYKSFKNMPGDENKRKASSRVMGYLTSTGHPELAVNLYDKDLNTQESNWEYVRALKKLDRKADINNLPNLYNSIPKGKYIDAWLNENNKKSATNLYKEALRISPLYEEGVIEAIDYLKDKQTKEETYEMLLTSVMLNQYSIPIQKAYVRQSIETNYFNFADYSLNKLKDLMDKIDFEKFEKEVAALKEKKLSEIEWK